MAAGEVSTILSEWLLVGLIVFTLFIEFALHRLEHWVRHKHHHLTAVVRVLYRELMILGIISFIFIIYELSFGPTGDIVLSFEFAHLFIFLFAIFYTIVVLITMYMSSRMSFKWKQMEKMDLVHYLSLKDKYNTLNAVLNKRTDKIWRTFWWFPNFSKLVNFRYMHEVMSFHDIRFQFIYYRNLPEDFRFSSFLRKIKSTTFIDLVESHWSLYVIFLVIVLLDILRRTIFGEDQVSKSSRILALVGPITTRILRSVRGDDDKPVVHSTVEYGNETDAILIICFSVLLAFIAQILAMKIKKIFWKITQHPRTYYEGVQAETVEEELMKAAHEREILRDRRRSRSISLSKEKQSMDENDTGNEGDVDDGTHKYEMKQRKLEQQYQQQITTEEETNFEDDLNDVDPVNELLDPMHAQPLQSPLVKNTSSQNLAAMDANGELETGMEDAHAQVNYSARHSMERARTELASGSNSNHAQRSLTDLQPSVLSSHRENANIHHDASHGGDDHGAHGGGGHEEHINFFDHDEHSHDESVVRHSLDVPRRNKAPAPSPTAHGHSEGIEAPTTTSVSSTTSTILARAALEAAKKRTQSEIPAASSSAAAQQQSDNESTSSLTLPGKMGSPKFTSRMSSRRGSIDNSYTGSRRGSLDAPRGSRYRRNTPGTGNASGNKGQAPSKLSIELAVVMARDELKTQLEKPTAFHFDTENESDKEKSKDRKILSRRSLSPGDNRVTGGRLSHHRSSLENQSDQEGGTGGSIKKEQRIRFSVDTSNKESSTATAKNNGGEVRIDMNEIDDEDRIEIEVKNTGIDALTKAEQANMNNPTIMKYFEEHRDIENIEPTHYPKIVKKLIPRLGRVATRVEKLFWFGSHRFYMWCVEFVLFFSTILLAAATAGISLILVENKKEPNYAITINALHITSVITAVLNLFFVLFRIAIIMQRYIFILHNASLIPEVVALEAIQNVRGKKVAHTTDDYSDEMSGSETEREDDEAARERRKKLGRFFRSEAESGNITGIEGKHTEQSSNNNSNGINNLIRQSLDYSSRRKNKRRAANQRRRVRLWNNNTDASATDTNNDEAEPPRAGNDDEVVTRSNNNNDNNDEIQVQT